MGCVIVYPVGNPPRFKIHSGQLDRKPCRWMVTVWYDVGILQDTEKNPRCLKVRADKPLWLQDLMGFVNTQIEPDRVNCGGITNVRWRAVQER